MAEDQGDPSPDDDPSPIDIGAWFEPSEAQVDIWRHMSPKETVTISLPRGAWDHLFAVLEANINGEARSMKLALALAAGDREAADRLVDEWSAQAASRWGNYNRFRAAVVFSAIKNRPKP